MAAQGGVFHLWSLRIPLHPRWIWTGELRDMIAQLPMIAAQLGVDVEIPPDTQRAIDREDLENPLTLPAEAVW